MQTDSELSELIGHIYDCALDTTLWPAVLGLITRAVGGKMGDMIVSDAVAREQRIVALHNWPDDLAAITHASSSIHPLLPLGLTAPLDQPICIARDLDLDAFHASRYWATCFADRDIYDYLVVPLSRTVVTFASWGVLGDRAKGAFTSEDVELARLLSPHIRRAVHISGVIGRQRIEVGTLRAALEALASAALIIEPDGTVLFANREAEAELTRALIFRSNGGRVSAVVPEARKLLARLASASERARSRGQDANLTDAGGRTLHVTWAVLEQAGEEIGSPILLLLREPDAALETPLSIAAGLYGLTPAETQVLGRVLEGLPLAEVAAILGITAATVKTHLQRIFRKSQTSRQAELVARVMSLTSPLKR